MKLEYTRQEVIDNLYWRLYNNGLIETEQKGENYRITIKSNGNSIILVQDADILIYLQALCNAYNV